MIDRNNLTKICGNYHITTQHVDLNLTKPTLESRVTIHIVFMALFIVYIVESYSKFF